MLVSAPKYNNYHVSYRFDDVIYYFMLSTDGVKPQPDQNHRECHIY